MLRKNNIPDLLALFRADPQRGRRFRLQAQDWHLDYSGLPLIDGDLEYLQDQARERGLAAAVAALFGGAMVNPSEAQAALHMALRAARPEDFPGVEPGLASERERFINVAARLHAGQSSIRDLIHIGIGGSDLGPRLVADALDADQSRLRVHWLSTLDGRRFERLLARLDPQTTGVMVASKSFSTEESLTQARAVRDWMGQGFGERAWAATAQPARAIEFGLAESAILPIPNWVGGRFSLWSSVGFSAAARIGPDRFRALLAGAERADRDFATAPEQSGLATTIALLMHFLRHRLGHSTLGVIAYEPRLALLGDYLQQLVMESLGKGVDLGDQPLGQPSSPLIFGGRGTDLQHSIFQALHQGPESHPLILVGTLADADGRADWQQTQLAHLLAQAAVLTRGRRDGQPYQAMPGQRPVAILLARELGPESLGYLLASFEHAVFALSVLWNVNPFDQWGVEEGKRVAARFAGALKEQPLEPDTALDLLSRIRAGSD